MCTTSGRENQLGAERLGAALLGADINSAMNFSLNLTKFLLNLHLTQNIVFAANTS